MEQTIKITNHQDSAIIDIEGVIGIPEEWQFEEPQQRIATYEKFRLSIENIEQIKAANVTVNIRSTGGDVNDAILIYDALASLDAQITTRCWGYAASAATVIAQAASSGLRQLSENALYLIHDSSSSVEGNAQELERRVDLLRKTDETLAQIYSRRSGREVSQYTSLMAENNGQGRWLNATETIEAGLADSIIVESNEGSTNPIKALVTKVGETLGLIDKGERPHDPPQQQQVMVRCGMIKPQLSLVAFEQLQRELSGTTVESVEDPSLQEVVMSGNARAYHDDARRMSRV